ncbi:hypothetical protein [Methanosarcina horonobensis]|uniref:hypothetical protein n=1 Tax=Methanosarcina horonobensis TaxID=418008 RepID=UPI0022B898AB|nr:hypothetical protein [Methanosarcina horonobensis]
MKKTITAILLGILLISAFGAVVVSAVASNDTGIRYGSGPMHRWAARYTDSGYVQAISRTALTTMQTEQ